MDRFRLSQLPNIQISSDPATALLATIMAIKAGPHYPRQPTQIAIPVNVNMKMT